jgi:mannose-6-phosphate isomerase-like protein (cupin superfamily)
MVKSISELKSRSFMGSRLSIKFLKIFPGWPVSMAHEIMHKNGKGMPWGLHKKTSEVVYVISGKAKAYLGSKKINVRSGDYLLIPPGVKHRFVTGSQEMVAISVFNPSMTFNNLDAVVCKGTDKKRTTG